MGTCARIAIAIVVASLAFPLVADDVALAERALQALASDSTDHWAYTETTVENGKSSVRRFDPRRPESERWELLSVEGRPPTAEERQKDAERRAEHSGSGEAADEESSEIEVRGMIRPDSLSLIEETATEALYRFEPVAEDEDDSKLYEYLDATLRIVKDGPYVSTIEMRSRGPFSPGFGMKIKEFSMTLTFEPVVAGGPALPRGVQLRMLGRALLVKKVEEHVEVTYAAYEHVGG